MPKKKIAEVVPKQNSKSRVRVIPPVASKARTAEDAAQIGPPLIPAFENKVGHYDLIRVDGEQAYYSFTNRDGRTTDAVMSVTMWRRMQSRAEATFKETA